MIEWLRAPAQPAAILAEGDYLPRYSEPVTEPLAVLFSSDGEGAVIEGTREELLAMLERTRKLVEAAPHGTY